MSASLEQPSRAWRPASRILYPVSVFLLFFGLYTLTLAPGILPADSGEFQVVATVLGVAHPPGFPFYTLLGKLFIALLPVGTPAYRLNLLSAILAALTLTFVLKIVRRTTGSWSAGFVAASALGVSTTFWSQATTANVRILTALCAAMALYFLTFLIPLSRDQAAVERDARRLTGFAFSLGLGVSHHASLAFMGAVFISCLVLSNLRSLISRPPRLRRWIAPLAAALAPWLFTVYLPLRGAAGAFLAPPHLNTLPGLLEHVLARGFGSDFFYFAHFKDLPDRLTVLGNILTFQFNAFLLSGALIGLLAVLLRDRRYFFLLGGSFAVHSFVAITYRAPQTVEYMLPAYIVLAITMGCGMGAALRTVRSAAGVVQFAIRNSQLATRAPLHPAKQPFTLHALTASFCLASFFLFLRNLPSYLWLSNDESAREYAEAVLKAAPQDALVLALWHWATPMWYLQRVEGLRPDVAVEYVFPSGESLARNWVERIATNVGQRPVVVTAFYPLEYSGTPYRFAPLGPAWLVSQSPITDYPLPLFPVDLAFGGRWTLAGFSVERTAAAPGETIPVIVAWQAPEQPEDINFFVQLIGPDGGLYGQMDVSRPAGRYAPNELLVDRYLVTARPDAPPGDYTLIAGAYTPGGHRLTLDEGMDHAPLITVHVSLITSHPVTRRPSLSRFLPGVRLIGYDYDNTLPDSTRLYLHWRLGDKPETATVWYGGSPFVELALPAGPGYLTTATDLPPLARNLQVLTGRPRTPSPFDPQTYALADPAASDRYVPLGGSMVLVGERHTRRGANEVIVDLDFLSTRPLVEDDIVKVDLIGPNYSWRVESNSVPAGGAIPTLKWVAGSFVHDRHRLVLPPDAPPAPARLELAVYDHFTERGLPILDPRLAMIGPTTPLGEIENR